MKASDLKGRAVITVSDATKVGQIDDVFFDASYRKVLGFGVKSGGMFRHMEAVPRANVTAVGTDAVTIPNPEAVNTPDRFPDLAGAPTLSAAKGTKVVTEGGELLGTIGELDLDDEARSVTSYILAVPLLDRLRHREPSFSADQVTSLGEGGIMVVSNVVAELVKEN